jgi:hypothetical protein
MRASGVAAPSRERLFLALTVLARGLTLPALGLAAVASSKLGARPTDAEIDAGYAFYKATAVVLAAAYVAYGLLAVAIARSRDELGASDLNLFRYSVATLPLFLVILVYHFLVAFDRRSASFQPWNLHPYPEAFMSTAMEFVIVIVLVLVGLWSPAWRPSLADRGYETPVHNFPGDETNVFRETEPINGSIELEQISPRTVEPTTAQPTPEHPAPVEPVIERTIVQEERMESTVV